MVVSAAPLPLSPEEEEIHCATLAWSFFLALSRHLVGLKGHPSLTIHSRSSRCPSSAAATVAREFQLRPWFRIHAMTSRWLP